jgi:hypothetical protein
MMCSDLAREPAGSDYCGCLGRRRDWLRGGGGRQGGGCGRLEGGLGPRPAGRRRQPAVRWRQAHRGLRNGSQPREKSREKKKTGQNLM